MIVSVIVAASENDVIGRDGTLPWHLPEDMRRFRKLTTAHVVVMGRATYESILGRLGHPLPDRDTIVVSRTLRETGHARVRAAASLPEALRLAAGEPIEAGEPVAGADDRRADAGPPAGEPEVFIAGGASVYAEALPLAARVYLTRVHRVVDGDRSMPPAWLDGFELVGREAGRHPGAAMPYEFLDYRRART